MNPDLHTALLTSNDCTCTRWVDSDGDERLPRNVRERNLDCPDHGVNAARVQPPEPVCDHSAEVAILRTAADDIEYLATVLGGGRVDAVAYLRRVAERLSEFSIPSAGAVRRG